MESIYSQRRRQVYDAELSAGRALHGNRVFANSRWLKSVGAHVDTPNVRADLQRMTFYSGGVLHMSFAAYKHSMKCLAEDISHGVVLPLNEVAYNTEGVRLYFELDYRLDRVPTDEETTRHIMMAHGLARDAFPEHAHVDICVSTCAPKIKRKKNGEDVIASGIHLVFPQVVTYTDNIKMLNDLLDYRMTLDNPLFGGVVDSASVHASHASLRPNHCHKLDQCGACNSRMKLEPTKRRRNVKIRKIESMDGITAIDTLDDRSDEGIEFSLSEEEPVFERTIAQSAMFACDDCINGRKVNPSTYTLVSIVRHDTTLDTDIQNMPLLDKVMMTSIVPLTTGPCQFSNPFVTPIDIPHSVLDAKPAGHVLFRTERRLIVSRLKGKDSHPLRAGQHPELYRLLTSIIHESVPSHRQVLPANVSVNHDSRYIHIDLHGPRCRVCPVHGAEHASNRVYFSLSLKYNLLYMHCYDPSCRAKIHNARKSRKRKRPPRRAHLSMPDLDTQTVENRMTFRISPATVEQLHVHLGMPMDNPPTVVKLRTRPDSSPQASSSSSTTTTTTTQRVVTDTVALSICTGSVLDVGTLWASDIDQIDFTILA
jgi:hypothetical protein